MFLVLVAHPEFSVSDHSFRCIPSSYSKERVTVPLCVCVKQLIIDQCLGHLVFWRCRQPQIAYPPPQKHAGAESKVNYHTGPERRREVREKGEHQKQ